MVCLVLVSRGHLRLSERLFVLLSVLLESNRNCQHNAHSRIERILVQALLNDNRKTPVPTEALHKSNHLAVASVAIEGRDNRRTGD